MLLAIVQLMLFATVFVYTQFLEYLDWHGRSDVLKEKHPKVWVFVNNRPMRLVLSLLVLGFLVKDFKDAVAVAPPPTVKIVTPVAPAMIFNAPSTPAEPKDSLRRRTIRLADEVNSFVSERQQHHPPVAYPDSNDPNPSDERRRAIKLCQDYDQETQNQYIKRYRDRMIGIVREYHAKGVPTHFLENDFKQRVPGVAFVGSDWEGSPMDELSQFRDLAYRVDARDHLIVF